MPRDTTIFEKIIGFISYPNEGTTMDALMAVAKHVQSVQKIPSEILKIPSSRMSKAILYKYRPYLCYFTSNSYKIHWFVLGISEI